MEYKPDKFEKNTIRIIIIFLSIICGGILLFVTALRFGFVA